jgi:ABC-type multidrug transport system permease subunit
MRITFRNPAAVGMQIAMPAMMGVVLGTLFQGVGKGDFSIAQLMFIFILLTMLSLQSLPLMPLLIEERAFMKHETSEKLYTESAHILTTTLVTVPLSLMGATIQTLIIYAFSGLPYEFLPTILGWTLLLFFMFDALFQCVAAAAPDGEQAMTMATPWLVIFMLFNGIVVTKATAPVFLRWVFELSPTCYALEAISIRMTRDEGGEQNFWVKSLGYQSGHDTKGIAVICCMIVVLRLLQVLALKFLNNVQK